MPAPAVILAPVAYTKVVAVKRLVVGFLARRARPLLGSAGMSAGACLVHSSGVIRLPLCGVVVLFQIFYFEKIRVFKAGLRF